MRPKPPPPFVQKGASSLPSSGRRASAEETGGAIRPHQLGVPASTASKPETSGSRPASPMAAPAASSAFARSTVAR